MLRMRELHNLEPAQPQLHIQTRFSRKRIYETLNMNFIRINYL